MSKKLTALEKLSKVLFINPEFASDLSVSWARMEGEDYVVEFTFTGDGKKFEEINFYKKQKVVEIFEEKIFTVTPKSKISN
jgi:hypothetical protein